MLDLQHKTAASNSGNKKHANLSIVSDLYVNRCIPSSYWLNRYTFTFRLNCY
jgi:hypothetical protein